MDKTINSNGFDYVDLGLPSGTKWATMNVGASKPSDYGLYFQWGFSKYNTVGDTLDLEDDAANIHMGGDWHMPTDNQIQELIDNTTSAWTTQDGVNGRLFSSKNNGNSIFIPAAGYASGGSLYDVGSGGYVWSSVLSSSNVGNGQYLSFRSGGAYLNGYDRDYGFSVRGVLDKSLGHKHFEPFQKVLIKEWLNSKSLWVPAIYSHYDATYERHYVIGGNWAKDEHIIPYEGNECKVGKSAKK